MNHKFKKIRLGFFLRSIIELLIIMVSSFLALIYMGLLPLPLIIIIIFSYFRVFLKNYKNIKHVIKELEKEEEIIYNYDDEVLFTTNSIICLSHFIFTIKYKNISCVYKIRGVHLGNSVDKIKIIDNNKKKYSIILGRGPIIFLNNNKDVFYKMSQIIKKYNSDVDIEI